MMRARVDGFRYRARGAYGEEQLMVGDHSLVSNGGGGWAAPLEAVAHTPLASLRNALLAYAANWYYRDDDDINEFVGTLRVSPASATQFDDEYLPFEPVSILVHGDGRVLLEIVVRTESAKAT